MGRFDVMAAAQAPPARALPGGERERLHLQLMWAGGVVVAALLIVLKVNASASNGLVFNEMLTRLLHGRFDIAPSVIGEEGIAYHGRTYAYFGIFCALLRLPLLAIGLIALDVTKVSIIAAAAVSLGARLLALDLALRRARGVSPRLRLILLAAVAFGGESLQYLRPSIFQEVCCWGDALAAVFGLLAVRRIVGGDGRTLRLYAGMAAIAGLGLLCRVSCGLGLYAALGLMLCVEAWRGRARLLALRPLAPAVLILALFAGAACGVNYARWQSPLTFVPLRYQLMSSRFEPDRVERLDRYGEINPVRIPLALQYYFAPAWMLQDGKGQLLFQKTQLRLFDCVELPPSSFFLSDPVVCVLAGLGLWSLARRRVKVPEPMLAAGAALGLAAPAAVMLLAISLTFRYRMDFYPLLDFAACLGAAGLSLDPLRQPIRKSLYAAAGGAVVSVVTLTLYCYAPFGSALDQDLSRGWLGPIIDQAHGRDPFVGRMQPDGHRILVPHGG